VYHETLQIAKEELTKLQSVPKPKEKIKGVVIRIDKNADNIYATLRSELEHARDIIKGGKITEGNHFARYKGKNEAEIAPDFVKHKADKRKQILTGETPNSEPVIEEPFSKDLPERDTTGQQQQQQPNSVIQSAKTANEVLDSVSSGAVKLDNLQTIDETIAKLENFEASSGKFDFESIINDANKMEEFLIFFKNKYKIKKEAREMIPAPMPTRCIGPLGFAYNRKANKKQPCGFYLKPASFLISSFLL